MYRTHFFCFTSLSFCSIFRFGQYLKANFGESLWFNVILIHLELAFAQRYTQMNLWAQGAYKSGKPGRPGNVREFCNSGKLREISGNLKCTQGIFRFVHVNSAVPCYCKTV